MEILKQKPYLITLLVLLLAVRFVVQPLLAWQDDVAARATLREKQLSRAETAIANEQLLGDNVAQLQQRVTDDRKAVYPHEDENRFHLTLQQQMENLVSQLGLKVAGIGWLATKERPEMGLMLHQLQIRIQGDGVHLPALMAQLESSAQRIEISDFSVDFRQQTPASIGDSQGSITLNFYMEQGKTP